MAAMSTTLNEYTTIGDKRTYSVPGHTMAKPKIVVCKRTVPTGNKTNSGINWSVIYATEDAEGNILPNREAFSVNTSTPIAGQDVDRDAALAVFRDLVASDEFGAAVVSGDFPL